MVNWNTDYCKIIKAIEWRFYQSLSIYILMINLMSKSKNNIFGSTHLNGIKIQSPLLMVILLYGTFWSWGNFVISTDSTSTMLYPPSRTQPSAITRFSYFWNTILSKWLRSIFFEQMKRTLHQLAWSISLYDRKASKLKHNSKYFSVCVCNSCKE